MKKVAARRELMTAGDVCGEIRHAVKRTCSGCQEAGRDAWLRQKNIDFQISTGENVIKNSFFFLPFYWLFHLSSPTKMKTYNQRCRSTLVPVHLQQLLPIF